MAKARLLDRNMMHSSGEVPRIAKKSRGRNHEVLRRILKVQHHREDGIKIVVPMRRIVAPTQ